MKVREIKDWVTMRLDDPKCDDIDKKALREVKELISNLSTLGLDDIKLTMTILEIWKIAYNSSK